MTIITHALIGNPHRISTPHEVLPRSQEALGEMIDVDGKNGIDHTLMTFNGPNGERYKMVASFANDATGDRYPSADYSLRKADANEENWETVSTFHRDQAGALTDVSTNKKSNVTIHEGFGWTHASIIEIAGKNATSESDDMTIEIGSTINQDGFNQLDGLFMTARVGKNAQDFYAPDPQAVNSYYQVVRFNGSTAVSGDMSIITKTAGADNLYDTKATLYFDEDPKYPTQTGPSQGKTSGEDLSDKV